MARQAFASPQPKKLREEEQRLTKRIQALREKDEARRKQLETSVLAKVQSGAVRRRDLYAILAEHLKSARDRTLFGLPPLDPSKKSPQTQLERLLEKQRALRARIEQQQGRAQERAHKKGITRQFLYGVAVLGSQKAGQLAEESVREWLDQELIRDADRILFNLPLRNYPSEAPYPEVSPALGEFQGSQGPLFGVPSLHLAKEAESAALRGGDADPMVLQERGRLLEGRWGRLEQARKSDTRRKFLLGFVVQARLARGELSEEAVKAWLQHLPEDQMARLR